MERIWEYYCIYRTGNLNWYGSYLYRSLCIVAEGIPHERAVNHCFCHHHVFGGGTIPTYLLLKQLHILNTVWSIVLPGAFNVWLAIVGRTFINPLFRKNCLKLHALMEVIISSILPEWCCPWLSRFWPYWL